MSGSLEGDNHGHVREDKADVFREKLSINEIVKRTSLSRNTVRKWLHTEEGREPQYRRQAGSTNTYPFADRPLYADRLRQMLVADSHSPKRDRRTALMLFDELMDYLGL